MSLRSTPPAAAGRGSLPPPDVSAIVPLREHLGLALACVASLVRGQTYARDRFEVIVVTDEADPALERRVEALLGPRDRMLRYPTTNIPLLYNLGAQEARGTLLFFTESHCIVEPECLEQLVGFLAARDDDGACCRSVSIPPSNGWARMEERFHEAYLRTFSGEGDWRKILRRGFAIYREVFLEEGGFEPRFDLFADWALGARLHSRGRRLGYAAQAAVQHPYTTDPSQLLRVIRDFTRGECACRLSASAAYCERYFGHAEEWANRESLRRSTARAVCRASWRSLASGGWALRRAQAGACLRFLPAALLGPGWRLLGARWALRLAVARARLWRWREARLYRAYVDAYDRMVRVSRLEFIAEQLSTPSLTPPGHDELQLGEVADAWLVGFHPVERWGGLAFRWSGPVALVRLGLARGRYEVRVETRGLRGSPIPLRLAVFFNRSRISPDELRWHGSSICFRLDAAMFAEGAEQHLVLTCNPVRPWEVGVPDRRELGLPIFSITFTPTGA
jgi:hypothetical protein